MKNRTIDVITLMVDNEFGVLTRVTALIRREGWNIRSLAVAETENTDVSRLTVALDRRHSTLDHVLGRLSRLGSVREVTVLTPETQVGQELCLVRVDGGSPALLEALHRDYDVQRLGEDGGDALLSIRCAPHETDGFLGRCREIGLRDIARTGIVALDIREKKA